MSDAVDAIVGQWEKERPELRDDLWPVQLIARVQRMNRVLDREAKVFCAKHGVEWGEFDVLTTLRRSGPPYALTAGASRSARQSISGGRTTSVPPHIASPTSGSSTRR